LSWTSPVKIRQILIGGTKKMVVFNDCELTEKVKVYDAGFQVSSFKETKKMLVDYRVGDIYIPKVSTREALKTMVDDFLDAIIQGQEPLANCLRGLYVVEILEAAERSLKKQGQIVNL
ncbi:MAG: gfo/Idh/MocA family oxidoreductase, partial [Patescibacteria group bacterium]